jgi:uncharacterized RDD family membrane protein YckC
LLVTAILFVGAWIFLLFSAAFERALARLLLQIHLAILAAIYFIYCWTHGGQTLAMKTWRLRLVMQDGRPVELGAAVYRYLAALLSTALGGAGFLWALVDRDHQFLHDRIAGTRIVSE